MTKREIDGASVKDRAPGQPQVADLPTNRTLLVAEVSPSISNTTAPIEAQSLTDLVKKVQKLGAIELRVDLEDIVLDQANGAIVKEEGVAATMTYGEEPSLIMSDFDPAALVAKTERGAGAATQTESRLLVRQRLTSLLIEQLLERIARDGKFRDSLSDPQKCRALLAAIEQEIDRIEPEVAKASEDRLVQGPGGVA